MLDMCFVATSRHFGALHSVTGLDKNCAHPRLKKKTGSLRGLRSAVAIVVIGVCCCLNRSVCCWRLVLLVNFSYGKGGNRFSGMKEGALVQIWTGDAFTWSQGMREVASLAFCTLPLQNQERWWASSWRTTEKNDNLLQNHSLKRTINYNAKISQHSTVPKYEINVKTY